MYISPHGVLRTTYRCDHGHVESVRVVKVEPICVSKGDFFLGMVFVETILLNDERMVKQVLSSVEDAYLRQNHDGWHRSQ